MYCISKEKALKSSLIARSPSSPFPLAAAGEDIGGDFADVVKGFVPQDLVEHVERVGAEAALEDRLQQVGREPGEHGDARGVRLSHVGLGVAAQVPERELQLVGLAHQAPPQRAEALLHLVALRLPLLAPGMVELHVAEDEEARDLGRLQGRLDRLESLHEEHHRLLKVGVVAPGRLGQLHHVLAPPLGRVDRHPRGVGVEGEDAVAECRVRQPRDDETQADARLHGDAAHAARDIADGNDLPQGQPTPASASASASLPRPLGAFCRRRRRRRHLPGLLLQTFPHVLDVGLRLRIHHRPLRLRPGPPRVPAERVGRHDGALEPAFLLRRLQKVFAARHATRIIREPVARRRHGVAQAPVFLVQKGLAVAAAALRGHLLGNNGGPAPAAHVHFSDAQRLAKASDGAAVLLVGLLLLSSEDIRHLRKDPLQHLLLRAHALPQGVLAHQAQAPSLALAVGGGHVDKAVFVPLGGVCPRRRCSRFHEAHVPPQRIRKEGDELLRDRFVQHTQRRGGPPSCAPPPPPLLQLSRLFFVLGECFGESQQSAYVLPAAVHGDELGKRDLERDGKG
mmetsp:Transcript_3766/g.8613  ORF Transcript_3766/g.8613 Transcript_3766/m.8613 type:complete len:567 (+) Transcript_3766:675-2375(+)